MKLQKISNARIGDFYYSGRHSSGLRVLLYPKEDCVSTYAMFGTRYGSIDNCFQCGDEAAPENVPEGIAHFLEHKLFESETGDAFSRFAKTGASANAFTGFESTCYLFSCTDRLYDSMEILLDFVTSPYFTKETVEKEQGIIGQEIRMYDDDPQWRVMFNFLRAMYHTHPVRIDVAGTKESIEKITPDHLYRCYNTFYNLNNMVLAIVGNFDAGRVSEVCDRVLKPSEPFGVKRFFENEPASVVQNRIEEKFSVSLPLFQFGYKESAEKIRSEKDIAAMEVLLEIMASDASPLFQELLQRELINEASFSFEYFEGTGYASVSFSGESNDPQAVSEAIQAEAEKYQRKGIPEDVFERFKRAIYGESVAAFNSLSNIANFLVSFSLRDREVFTYLDALASLRLEEVEEKLKVFSQEQSVLSVITPAE